MSVVAPTILDFGQMLLTSFGKNSQEAPISKEPTKIVEKLSVNSNYPKKSLYGLTLTKPLRQFHDLQ